MYGRAFSGVPKEFHSDPGKVTFLTLIQLLIIPASLQVHIKFMCENTFLQLRSSIQPGITEHLNLKHSLHLVKYICICTRIYMYIYMHIYWGFWVPSALCDVSFNFFSYSLNKAYFCPAALRPNLLI